MKKFTVIAMAVAMSATVAHAQTVTSEKTVRTETSTNGAVRTTTEHQTASNVTSNVEVSPAYWTRLESAYKHAGVPETEIRRLRDIDMRVVETRRANPEAELTTYYEQQSRILKPEQITKVRTYLREHKPAPTLPAYEVTTYETVPVKTGVGINTPIGSIGVGVPTGSAVVEERRVVPAN